MSVDTVQSLDVFAEAGPGAVVGHRPGDPGGAAGARVQPAAGEGGAAGEAGGDPASSAPRRGHSAAATVAVGLVVAAVPFAVALAAVRMPHWYPVLDRASFELRLRDVGTPDTPLVGVVARLESGGEQGNHPGPLTFYVMAPVYRLLGATQFAMLVAVAWAHALGIGMSLWLAARRGGAALGAGVGATIAVLLHGIGMAKLVDPWNPYIVLFWFLAFLLAVWAAIDGDRVALPVAAFTGTFCAQSHVEYVPLVGALALLTIVWLTVRAARTRHAGRGRRACGTGAGAGAGGSGGTGAGGRGASRRDGIGASRVDGIGVDGIGVGGTEAGGIDGAVGIGAGEGGGIDGVGGVEAREIGASGGFRGGGMGDGRTGGDGIGASGTGGDGIGAGRTGGDGIGDGGGGRAGRPDAVAGTAVGWTTDGGAGAGRSGSGTESGALRWGGAAVVLGALLWVPLVLDEVRRSPGNLQIMIGQFRDGTLPPVGLWPGTRALLVNADPIRILRGEVVGEYQNHGPIAATCVMLAAWAVAAIAAVGARRASLVRLHAVVAVGFAVGCLAMSRITGPLWFWLGIWGTILGALAILTTVWTAAALWPRRPGVARVPGLVPVSQTRPDPTSSAPTSSAPAPAAPPTPAALRNAATPPTPPTRAALARRGVAVLVGLGVVFAGVATAAATSAEVEDTGLSDRLALLVPPTIAALESGEVPGTGADGTYVVTSTDPVDLGMHAIGIVDELDRRGFRVGMAPAFRSAVTEHRVIGPGEASAVIHLSVGPDIDEWRARPGATEVAHVDHRSAAERAEYDRTHDDLVAGLEAQGLDELVHQADVFVMALALNPDVPLPLRDKAERLMEIGLPTSIFVAPAPAPAPPAG